MKKKKMIFGCGIIIVLCILIILFFTVIRPYTIYKSAVEACESKNFETAIEKFTEIENFKDAEMRLHYVQGMMNLQNSNYEDAIKFFELAKGTNDSEDKLKEANYEYGINLFLNESYKEASDYFKKAKDYKDAKIKYTVCIAEKFWEEGYLNRAEESYKKLSEDTEYNGIKVSDRLELLSDNERFVKICGKWRVNIAKSLVQIEDTHFQGGNTSTVSVDTTDEGYISIVCKIESNGNVMVSGDAKFAVATKDWHSQWEIIEFEDKSIKKANQMIIFPNSETTIEFNGKQFILEYINYEYDDEEDSFYTYKSKLYYTKRIEEY